MEKTIKLIAPAKVNLFLAVGEKDGTFHPVLNVMHSLILHDVLYVTYSPSNENEFYVEMLHGEDPDVALPEVDSKNNIVYKAIESVAKLSRKKYSVKVLIEKNIPCQAGLGGGSSDGAAALLAAGKIFGVDDDSVFELAQKLGADVAFFLKGGCALFTGHGEVLSHEISPVNRDIVLTMPLNKQGLSTKLVYETFDSMPQVVANLPELNDQVENFRFADNIPLFNNLSFASEKLLPELKGVREFLSDKAGADNTLLCGSGSCSFAYGDEKLEKLCKDQGWWATSTSLANVSARIIPTVVEQ